MLLVSILFVIDTNLLVYFRKDFDVQKNMRLDNYMSYLKTWSGYLKYQKHHPDEPVMQDLEKR